MLQPLAIAPPSAARPESGLSGDEGVAVSAPEKPKPVLDFATRKAVLFALVAERLSAFYEHGVWMNDRQGASLAVSWLSRAKIRLPPEDGRLLAQLSDEFARHLAGSLSREAGLYTAYEMMEALDPRYQSPHAQAMLEECERLLAEAEAGDRL